MAEAIQCDKCKKFETDLKGTKVLRIFNGLLRNNSEAKDFDLCPTCLKELEGWLHEDSKAGDPET